MKRINELRELSRDHHHGLVLARKAKKAAGGEEGLATTDVWADAEARFESELEPHFRIEESLIGAVLEKQGETGLATRLRDEHAALRAFFAPDCGRTAADLRRFGNLLEAHIRFEEHELFEVAQETLSPDALRAVADACHARDADESKT